MHPRRARAILVVAAAIAALAACDSGFFAADKTIATMDVDAAPIPEQDASGMELVADGGEIPPSDAAAPDAPTTIDSGPHTFCSDIDAEVCIDFDRGALPAIAKLSQSGGGTSGVLNTHALSQPSALLSELPSPAVASSGLLTVTLPAASGDSNLHCEWDLYTDYIPAFAVVTQLITRQNYAFYVAADPNPLDYNFILTKYPDNTSAAAGIEPVKAGGYQHAVFDMSTGPNGGSGTSSMSLGSAKATLAVPQVPVNDPITLNFGLQKTASDSDVRRIYIDNIWCRQ